MFHPHPLAQALPSRLGLVMSAGLLLQSFFGLDANPPRPSAADALRSQGARLTRGRSKKELAPSTVSGRAIIARALARRAAHFHLLQINPKLTLGETISVGTGRHLGRQNPFFFRKGSPPRASPLSASAHGAHH